MKRLALLVSLFALALPAFAAAPAPVSGRVALAEGAGQSGTTGAVIDFTWKNTTSPACPTTSPTSCASNYTVVDTTGLASGAALPTAACTSTNSSDCVAATSIPLTSTVTLPGTNTAVTGYQYMPLDPINTTVAYTHTYVLVTNGYDALGSATSVPSATATVTYTPFILAPATGFSGSVAP